MSVTTATGDMVGSLSSRRGSGPRNRCDRIHRGARRPRAARPRGRRPRDGPRVVAARRPGGPRRRARDRRHHRPRGDAASGPRHRARLPRRGHDQPADGAGAAAAGERAGHARGAGGVPGRRRRAGGAHLLGGGDRAGAAGRRARRAPRAHRAARDPVRRRQARGRGRGAARRGARARRRARLPRPRARRRRRPALLDRGRAPVPAAPHPGLRRRRDLRRRRRGRRRRAAAVRRARRGRRALHPRHPQLHVAAAVRRAAADLGRRGACRAAAGDASRWRSPRRAFALPGRRWSRRPRCARRRTGGRTGPRRRAASWDGRRVRTRRPSRTPSATTRSGSATGSQRTGRRQPLPWRVLGRAMREVVR